jgi:uncharacterized protein (TIGR02996 family)
MTSPYTYPDWELLLRAICAAPDDDLPRLVAADWLDENGEPERAEFIRVQIERERNDRPDLKWREQALLGNPLCGALWALEACPNLVQMNPGSQLRDLAVSGSERVRFRRGFPDRITCSAADWLRHGSGVVPRQPVQEIYLTRCDDLPPEQWWEMLGTLRQMRTVSIDSRRVFFPSWLQERLGAAEVWVNGAPAPLVLADQPVLAPVTAALPPLPLSQGRLPELPPRTGDWG